LQLAAVNEAALREPFGLESVFLEHQRRVFRAAYRITGNAQDAEDVLQTVFLRLHRQGDAASLENPSSYLYRAAINAALDLLRARRERSSVALEEAHGSPDGPGRRPDQVHEAAELRAGCGRPSPAAAAAAEVRPPPSGGPRGWGAGAGAGSVARGGSVP
jgi:RNA polymerase sigma-70 factor (ECF subfamily)